MDNIVYLHLASAYENSDSSELVSLSYWFNTAAAPDWKRLSSRAWKYMLPLALILSILSSVSSVWALQRGDRGPSVKTLQEKLQQAGFYQVAITQIYDIPTEAAVRRFQEAVGLPVDGIVGVSTLEKLDNWGSSPVSPQTSQLVLVSTQTTINTIDNASTQTSQNTTTNTQSQRTFIATSVTNKRQRPNYLAKGDEGEDVRVLQERLRVAGFYYGNPTGIFGPITEEAVKRFQAAYKLNVDGIVGMGTLQKLPPVGVGGGTDAPQQTAHQDTLTIGDRGEAVRLLQEQLMKTGYLQRQPNGYFGSYTAEAVKRFQADNYLAVSGIAGPTTRAKLHSLVSKTGKSDFNVLEIQRRLQAQGFYRGLLNGVMAEDTRKAIKQAQEYYGISLNDIRSGRF